MLTCHWLWAWVSSVSGSEKAPVCSSGVNDTLVSPSVGEERTGVSGLKLVTVIVVDPASLMLPAASTAVIVKVLSPDPRVPVYVQEVSPDV